MVLVVALHGPPALPAGAPFQPLSPAYGLPQPVELLQRQYTAYVYPFVAYDDDWLLVASYSPLLRALLSLL